MTEKFHRRFGIAIDHTEAQRRFINRIHNEVFCNFVDQLDSNSRFFLTRRVASRLGELHGPHDQVSFYVKGSFLRCLEVIEACCTSPDTYQSSTVDKLCERFWKKPKLIWVLNGMERHSSVRVLRHWMRRWLMNRWAD